MPIEFEDGGVIDASDWLQIKRLLAEKSRQAAATGEEMPKIKEIRSSDGVTIKLGNLELRKKAKMPLAQPDYIEGSYKGWSIRVWRQRREEIYGCNYFRPGSEDIRYFEVRCIDVADENAVFKTAKAYIDEAISNE
jgi:hypothetical protein